MIAIAALAWLVRTVRGRDDAAHAWAVAALAAQPLWFLGAQYANLDMLVGGCITLAICALAVFELDPTQRSARWIGFAALAAGVLAKGLIGVVLPLGVLGLWLAWERRLAGWLRLLWVPGWILFFVLTVPWFAAVEARHPGFVHYFIVVQHFQRYTGTGFNNMLPAWFFVAVVALGTLPWSPWLAGIFRQRPLGALQRLGLVWLVLITVFFSLPASKLVGYIFPAVPALALLACGPVAACAARTDRRRRLPAALAILGLVVGIVAAGAIARSDRKGNEDLAVQLRSQWQPGDALVYDHAYFFDLALLLGRQQDVPVLLEWNDPNAVRGDGWERELADAGAFDTARAAKVLVQPERWAALRCAAPRTWLVTRKGARTAATQALNQAPRLSGRNAEAYLVTCSAAQ